MNKDQDLDKSKKNFYQAQIKAQRKLIRKREIAKQKNETRYKRRRKRSKIKKKIKYVLKQTRLKTIQYLKRFFDPTILTNLVVAWLISRQINKMPNNPSYTMPISPPPEIHRDNSVSGTLKRTWEDHWPKILTGSGVFFVSLGKHLYSNWKLNVAEKKLVVAEKQLEVAQHQLVASQESFTEFRSKSKLEKELMQVDHDAQLAKKDEDFQDFKLESEKERQSLIQAHNIERDKLYVTLNRFNDQAMKSAKVETVLRQEIKQCRRQIGALVEERDLLKEQIIETQNTNNEKEDKISDLELQNKILTKKIEERADLEVQLERLKKERAAGILSRRKLNRKLKIANSNYKALRSELNNSRIELNNAKREQKRTETELQIQEKKCYKAQEEIDQLIQKGRVMDRNLQIANANTDRCVKQMDRVNHKIQLCEQSISTITRYSTVLEKQLEQKEDGLQKMTEENETLKENLDLLREEVGSIEMEKNTVVRQMQQNQAQLENASKKERKKLNDTIKLQEKQIRTSEKKLRKLKQQTRDTEYKLIDSNARQQNLAEQIVKLNNELDKQKDQLDEQKSTSQHYFAMLQQQRAEQDEKFDGVVTDHQRLLNQILDKQEQYKPWWSRIRIIPQFNINTGKTRKEDPPRETIHRFYPSFAHETLVPEEIIETEYPSGRKEIRSGPTLFHRAKK